MSGVLSGTTGVRPAYWKQLPGVPQRARRREVQTELSIAQASADLLATGALQYAVDDEGDEADDDMEPIFSRTAL